MRAQSLEGNRASLQTGIALQGRGRGNASPTGRGGRTDIARGSSFGLDSFGRGHGCLLAIPFGQQGFSGKEAGCGLGHHANQGLSLPWITLVWEDKGWKVFE